MRSLKSCLCLLVVFLVAGATVPAQARFLIPEKIERKTEAGEGGVLQWAAWEAIECPSCKGLGKAQCATCARFPNEADKCPECHRKEKQKDVYLAPCRACAGEGKILDPLEVVPCAGCQGAGFLVCTVCGGGGQMKINGAKRWSACPACRGDAGFPCGACDGKRTMSSVEIKPNLKEADDPDKLEKMLEEIDKTLAKFEAFQPIGGTKARKAVKALGAAYTTGKKVHPAFKDMAKVSKDYMGKIFGGSNLQGHDKTEANTMEILKSNAQYYLKHQRRMTELALKRAQANAELAEKK